MDRNENVWVTDTKHHLVFKFSRPRKSLLALWTSDKTGSGTDQFNKPTDVSIDSNAEVSVTDGYGISRVVKLDYDG